MPRSWLSALLPVCALSLGAGCLHARHVNDGTANPGETKTSAPNAAAPKNPEEEGHTTPPTDNAPPKTASAARATGTGGAGAASWRKPVAEPGHPALASSPAELRQPDGTRILVNALTAQGYLKTREEGSDAEKLSVAIRRFQQSQQLPETGFADRKTLTRLGLDPKKVDRANSPRNEGKAAKDDGAVTKK